MMYSVDYSMLILAQQYTDRKPMESKINLEKVWQAESACLVPVVNCLYFWKIFEYSARDGNGVI